jgi:hypothetical protein
MSVLLKCPDNHQNPIPLGRISCAYCKQFGIPVDASVDKNLIITEYNSLYGNIENNLHKLKALPEPSTAKLFFTRLLNILTIGLFSVVTKNKIDENSFKYVEADAERNKRLMENKFGEEEKVKELVRDINTQLSIIKYKQRKKQTKASLYSFALIIVLIGFVLLIFASPFPEIDEYLTENEKIELLNKQIDNKIIEGKYNDAKQIAGTLKFNNRTEALRKIRAAYLDEELRKVKNLIVNNKYTEAEISLAALNCEPIENPKYDNEERELINSFEKKKSELLRLITK